MAAMILPFASVSTRCAVALASLAGCALLSCGAGDDATSLSADEPSSTETQTEELEGLQPVTLQFEALVGDAPAHCGQSYSELGASADEVQLADARLYVSALAFRATDGQWVPLELDTSDWQGNGIALLDFEDGTAACADSGNPELNSTIAGQLPAGSYDAVRFELGVPFELNHVDAATADAPLNSPTMFWVWRGGYKFLRVDFAVEQSEVPRWNVHLGSTGCMSDAPTSAPDAPCSRTNSPGIELSLNRFSAGTQQPGAVELQLANLIAQADLQSNVADSPTGCQSNPAEAVDCEPVFNALGLSFETGLCDDNCSGQQLFSAVE